MRVSFVLVDGMIDIIIYFFPENTCGGKVNKKPVWSCNQWVGLKYCTEGNFVSYVTDNCDKACCENGNFYTIYNPLCNKNE